VLVLDLDPEAEIILTEEYSSEKAPDNSIFYRKIYEYQGTKRREIPFLRDDGWFSIR
jgi:hypothetical protein